MALDLPAEFSRAAGSLPELDDATFDRLSKPRRRSGRAASATVMVLLVAAGGWLATRSGSIVQLAPGSGGTESAPTAESAATPEPAATPVGAGSNERAATEPADPAQTVSSADLVESLHAFAWEVLAVDVTPVGFFAGGGGHAATDQGKVDRLWQTFDMQGSAPVLQSGQGALILPVSGSCDRAAQVRAIDTIVTTDARRVFAAVQLDASCAVLWSGGGAALPPSRTLYVIAVPFDVARQVSGAVAVTAVGDFSWEVWSVGVTQRWYYPASVTDQVGVDNLWRMFEMQPPAPALPAGHGALFVPAAGSCDNAAQVLAVNAIAGDDAYGAEALAAVYFDPSCAQPQPDSGIPGQSTLYLITVPLDVAASLRAAVAFIGCGNEQSAETAVNAPPTQCTDPTDNAVSANSAFGATVAAAIGDLDFDVLAVGLTPDPSLSGYIAADQATIDDLWQLLGMPGTAPPLRPDWAALFVPVAGTCDHTSSVGDIDVRSGANMTELVAVVHIDASCAEPPETAIHTPAPRTLYIIAVPLETAGRLDDVVALADFTD